MTGYDLQLHLRYRNSIWNKETETKYCSCTKMFYVTRDFYRFLHRGWAKFSPAKQSNFTEKGVWRRQDLIKKSSTFQGPKQNLIYICWRWAVLPFVDQTFRRAFQHLFNIVRVMLTLLHPVWDIRFLPKSFIYHSNITRSEVAKTARLTYLKMEVLHTGEEPCKN